MFHTIFYRGSMVLCLGVVYEYMIILVILINIILLINMNFMVKYH
jgi:type IV secretory pathway VirB3-like protein